MRTMRGGVVSAAVAMLLVTAVPGRAEEARQATGKFESKNWTFEPFGAYAYPDKVGLDDAPGIVVAVSNFSFDTAFFDRYWDRSHAIETYQKNDETLVAYLQFSRSGAYQGLTYSFGSGDGCGFCFDGSVKAAVKVEKGRIHGRATFAGEPGELNFDVEFDVPVAGSDFGRELPAGGGDPGKAYLGYHKAISALDRAAAKPYFSDKVQADYPEHADEILQAFRRDHPDTSAAIERGFVKGDRALLLVKGETSYSKVRTEVHLLQEKGSWRIVEEMLQIDFGE